MGYWLMKSEPTEYSIDDLMRDGCITPVTPEEWRFIVARL